MTRLLRAFTLAAALLGLLTIVACGGGGEGGTPTTQATATPTSAGEGVGRTPTTQATAAPPIPAGVALEMGIDPETTGNTCGPSPADCTLGTVEKCYAVTCPSAECTWDGSSTFDGISDYVVDVYVRDPAGSAPAPAVYDAWVNYCDDPNADPAGLPDTCEGAVGGVGEPATLVHIAAPGTNGKIKIDGAGTFSGADEMALPDTDGFFAGGWMNLPPPNSNPGVNTFIGDGPLLRLGLDIGASGLVTFSLDEEGSSYLSIGPGGGSALQTHPLTFKTAQLAINQGCP